MTKKGLIWIVIVWVVLTLVNYYYMPFFFLIFVWLGLCFSLLIVAIYQLIKLIIEIKHLNTLRISKFFIFITLFLLTLYSSITTNLIIEKVDWYVLESKRIEIVNKVKGKELNPNVSWNKWVCELPFEFPVVSNGGNDIGIFRNQESNVTTVSFWVFRNFFESPSTNFVFTDDPDRIKRIEEKIKSNPRDNWKIKDNWYRTYGD
jgi:predicted membrane protein